MVDLLGAGIENVHLDLVFKFLGDRGDKLNDHRTVIKAINDLLGAGVDFESMEMVFAFIHERGDVKNDQ